MASKICMNTSCGATSSIEWRKGWGLRSGGFANLCDKCGFAYKQLVFCDTFHLKESGWRECISCGKRLHCGCIASKSFLELLDNGGVECISCVKNSELSSIPSNENPNRFGISPVGNVCGVLSTSLDCEIDDFDKGKLILLGKSMKGIGQSRLLQSQQNDTDGSIGKIKGDQVIPPVGEVESMGFSTLSQEILGSSQVSKQDRCRETVNVKEMYESLAQTCLNITLGALSGTPNSALPLPGVVVEAREQGNVASPFQQGKKSHHLLPKPSKMDSGIDSEVSNNMLPQVRVARPPVDGRGRNQLLPRYWPRITDQELQQISGSSNSTIVPLFEKVLSASDAGRIGRLVLPKACAEAYFPPISQPEGLPLRIQDAKGNEWLFQFRFWPNNNSRMYVLEGVAPCIQAMQLQAGDTVTFSRIDPERKLVIGFRKAFSTMNMQSLKGSTDMCLSDLSKHLNSADGDICWRQTEKHGGWPNESFPLQPLLVPEKKRSRNIGSKSKRLVIGNEDALELKFTWEEAQDLLRPPPTVKPSIVMIDGYEFEEYEEPPVFGKKTIFTSRTSGEQDQWGQCDSCSRWRRLPADVLLPPKWTCVDNDWDPKRCSCSVPDEMSPKELGNILRLNRDFKKRRITTTHKPAQECEPSALEALATAAVLGDDGNSGTSSILTTTKHPRHRSGCTCIVCIQPPSGKGPKHKPTCTCNVCMTVKRRFETLMIRKKKRQSAHEADIAQRKFRTWGPKEDEEEVESSSNCTIMPLDLPDSEIRPANASESGSQREILADTSKGQIDLNCHPYREEDLQAGSAHVSMTSLLQEASFPLDIYLKQNGLTSLSIWEQQLSSSSHGPQITRDSESRPPDDKGHLTSIAQEDGGGERYSEQDQDQNNPK